MDATTAQGAALEVGKVGKQISSGFSIKSSLQSNEIGILTRRLFLVLTNCANIFETIKLHEKG